MLYPVTDGVETPLLPGDVVSAIDGRPLQPGKWPSLPADLQVGQTLNYTIESAGSPQEVRVQLIQPGPKDSSSHLGAPSAPIRFWPSSACYRWYWRASSLCCDRATRRRDICC
ncbi:MAG: hypothetical protein R3C44_10465 [Chloroflexota bacterium]